MKFKKHTREIFQFVENKGKFFVLTEILNKIYKNIIGIAKFKKFFPRKFWKICKKSLVSFLKYM